MSEKYKGIFFVISVLSVVISLIALCITKSTLFAVLLIGSLLSMAVISGFSIDYDGPGGVGGFVSSDPDPTGVKTKRGLIISWLAVVGSILYMYFNNLIITISISTPVDTKQFVPIFILFAIFGIFAFKR